MFLLFFVFASSLSAQTTPKNMLPPLAPAYGEIKPTFWEQHGTAMVVTGLLLPSLAGLIGWLIFRPKPPVPVPPDVLARETLMRLSRQPEDGKVLSETSQVLRRYIIAAFKLRGGELTTVEFSAMLAGSQKVGRELGQAVSGFLRECDERKFAAANPNTPFNAANRALGIIAEAEKQRVRYGVQMQT